MVLGFLGYLFSYRRKIFKLRKRYDRVREKTDKVKDANKRLRALKILDQVEPTLVMLEEQKVSRFDRGRMKGFVISGIEQAKDALSEDYVPAPKKQQAQPMQPVPQVQRRRRR